MPSRPPREQFEASCATLAAGFPLLVAVAAETRLAESSLGLVARELGETDELSRSFVADARRLELIASVSRARAGGHGAGRSGELFEVPRHLRQLVLRRAASEALLAPVVDACHAALGERSQAQLALDLHSGSLPELARWPDEWDARARREKLRATLLEPFDAAWLERTFGENALPTAITALGDALVELTPCSELFTWTASHFSLEEASEDDATDHLPASLERPASRVLLEHYLLRERIGAAEHHAKVLPLAERLGFMAAARFVEGDAARAGQLLDQSLTFASSPGAAPFGRKGSGRQDLPRGTFVSPLLALLLESRRTELSTQQAKKLLASAGESAEGTAKAFRTLLRHRASNGALTARINTSQVTEGASAWEVMLLGLTVFAHQSHEWTRAAWTKLLVERGVAWLGDYPWMARQALLLAQSTSPDQFEKEWEPERKRLRLPALHIPDETTAEALVRDLVRPPPEWELTLEALSQLATLEATRPEYTRRVDWFVNVANASFSRPGIAEYRDGTWTAARRVDLSEAFACQAELPPEDARVLQASIEADGGRTLLPDAWEALIGHPRVINGARGNLPVEVVRGECRIEARDEHGSLTLVVEPKQAHLGVNVVIEGEARVVVYRVTPALQRVFDLLPRGLRVPKEHQAQALRVLEQLSAGVEVRSPHFGATKNVPAHSAPCLRITPVAGAFLLQLGVRPFGARGRFFVAGSGSRLLSQWLEGEKLRTERSFELERARASALVAACPTLLAASLDEDQTSLPGDAADSWTLGHSALLTLLSELRASGLEHDFDWPESSPIRLGGSVSSQTLHGGLKRIKGWYLATGGVRIDDGTDLSLAELASFPSYLGGRFVQLPGGDYLEIEQRVRRVMAALSVATPVGRPATSLRLHESSLHALSRLRGPGSVFEIEETAGQWLERFERVRTTEYQVPAELNATLRPYQLEGFRWLSALSELSLGACLADDMGLGKTVQIIALLLSRAHLGPVLVVAPTSVCTNWMRELARFAPTLDAHEYLGTERSARLEKLASKNGKFPVLVCSYTVLQQDAPRLCDVEWGTVVLDEAQFIKNPGTQRARAAHDLKAGFRIAATGTPVENHLGDLWSIFHFLNPALLGPWRTFRHRFVLPVERDNDTERREVLRSLVQPYMLRRLKSQVLKELPPVTTILHEVRLSPEESKRYALLRRQIHEKLSTVAGRRQHKLEIFSEITRLRRFCCHPRLVFPDASSEATKVDVFLDLASELITGGHRALVFSQFVDFLDIVRERLDELGIPYEYLDGSTPKAERQKRVDAFQAGTAPLFLMSLKAGGMGLNLTAADYVIHLDPWWNPAVEAQATDRAHRIGQSQPVNVYRLITKDSIEESIVQLHEHKQRLADALLEGGDKASSLGVDELLALIDPRD